MNIFPGLVDKVYQIMKKIPFISQLKRAEQEQWINQLNLLIDQVEIVLPDHILQADKHKVEMAIVANPSEQQITQFHSRYYCSRISSTLNVPDFHAY